MAYTKTVWEDLPSEDTPINATALNNIEDGIDFAINTISPTAGSNGDYYTTLSNVTLTTGQCIKVLFPEPTDGTKDARFSIDGGNTYKNIVGGANNQLLANTMQNTAQKLFYNGTSWLCESNLVGIFVATGSTASGTISNLNIVRDGGIYDFVLFGTTASADNIAFRINNISTNNYNNHFIEISQSLTASGATSVAGTYEQKVSNFRIAPTVNGSNTLSTGTIALCGQRSVYSVVGGYGISGRQRQITLTGQLMVDTSNITSIVAVTQFSSNIAAGTTIKVYKRGL